MRKGNQPCKRPARNRRQQLLHPPQRRMTTPEPHLHQQHQRVDQEAGYRNGQHPQESVIGRDRASPGRREQRRRQTRSRSNQDRRQGKGELPSAELQTRSAEQMFTTNL